MKSSRFLFCVTLCWAVSLAADQPQTDFERSKSATQLLATNLKSELIAAMQSGGVSAAIEVCHERAPVLADQVSEETGVKVSRVSMKNRNPGNATNEWQDSVLNEFEKRKRTGTPVMDLNWSSRVQKPSGVEFRYMQAIPTGGVCLQCHGVDISPQTASLLADLYPTDQAVGYREGDIRGAFVAIIRQD